MVILVPLIKLYPFSKSALSHDVKVITQVGQYMSYYSSVEVVIVIFVFTLKKKRAELNLALSHQ